MPDVRNVALPLLCGALLLWSTAAPADEPQDDQYEALYQPPPAERRDGFAVGLTLGPELALASGYPNEADKIDDPAYEVDPGAGLGGAGTLWLGGAVRDWFVFGFGLSNHGAKIGDLQIGTSSFISHVEFYPLFSLGGSLRDLSLFGDFGAGGGVIKQGKAEVANGGILSTAGGGVYWELLRWGGFAGGPSVQYTNLHSGSLDAHFIGAGFRLGFYSSGG